MKRIISAVMALVALGLLGGCATTRSYTTLTVPSPAATITTTTPKVIVIDGVQDAREFQVDPRDPSIPSLKPGKEYALDANQRKSAIGRKRNTYGMALGDYMLKDGQTVESLTRDLVATTLRSLGYKVESTAGSAPDAEHVSVTVNQFWAWFTPGFWTATIEAKLETQLRFTGPTGDKSVEARGYGRNQIQTRREANWQLAYDRAFKDYEKSLRQALSGGT